MSNLNGNHRLAFHFKFNSNFYTLAHNCMDYVSMKNMTNHQIYIMLLLICTRSQTMKHFFIT